MQVILQHQQFRDRACSHPMIAIQSRIDHIYIQVRHGGGLDLTEGPGFHRGCRIGVNMAVKVVYNRALVNPDKENKDIMDHITKEMVL